MDALLINKHTALLIVCSMLPMLCYGQQRDKKNAIDIAKEFCHTNLPSIKGIGDRIKGTSEIGGSNLQTKTEEAYYILQGDSKGFVIVSGDERMPHVLAYSDESQFDVDSIPPSVKYWLRCYENVYNNLNNSECIQESELTSTIISGGVSPLLNKIQWDQSDPYNRLCPSYSGQKTMTGCVATAMAQVMKYHEYPAQGMGMCNYYTRTNNLHITRDLGKDVFDWSNMLPTYNHSFNDTNAKAVATLMASCGAAVQMDYGTQSQAGSGAYQSDLLSSFVKNFCYDPDAAFLIRSCCSGSDWHDLLINELNESRPVNYAGNDSRSGHSFVLDGYRKRDEMKYPDYHVNWGWSGYCDGWYQIADLQPEQDGDVYEGYNSGQQMTIRIKPNDFIDEQFTCLCSKKLKASATTCKAGDEITVITDYLYNASYHPFEGYISLYIVSNSGYQQELSKTKFTSLKSLEQLEGLRFEAILPEEIPNGIYQLQLFCNNKNGKITRVYSSSIPQISISANGDQPIPPSTISSTLGCSEVEFITNNKDSTEIRARVYEVTNLEEIPFGGDLCLIISDDAGADFTILGDSVHIKEIGTHEVLADPIILKGRIADNWPNGHYRIYIGVRAFGKQKFSPMLYYDYTTPNSDVHELYFDATIESGHIYIENNIYHMIPESIDGQKTANTNKFSFDLNGRIIGFPISHSSIIITNGRKIHIK